jgi:hypothetical protein
MPPAAAHVIMSLVGLAFGWAGLGAGAVAVADGSGGDAVPPEPPHAASPPASVPVSVITASPFMILLVLIALISQRVAALGRVLIGAARSLTARIH